MTQLATTAAAPKPEHSMARSPAKTADAAPNLCRDQSNRERETETERVKTKQETKNMGEVGL